jgi:hypothetical protein
LFVRIIGLLALAAMPMGSQSVRYPPKGSAEQRAIYERGQETQAKFEQELFVKAGFKPLDAIAFEKRTVKRALFEDPYMMLPVPGVEIERLPKGSVTLKVIGRTVQSAPAILPASAWTRLTSLQGALFKRKAYVPWDPPKADTSPLPPPPTCHGWIVRFGTTGDDGVTSGSWAQCGSNDQPELAYGAEIARLAVSTRPACKFDESNPFWSFSTCFSPRPQP